MTTLKLSGDKALCWWCGHAITDGIQHVGFEMGGKQYETTVCSSEHAEEVVERLPHG